MTRRGRYKQGEHTLPGKAPTFSWDLYEQLVKDSHLASQASKETIAEAIVTLRMQMADLRRRMEDGTASSEETKVVPSIASNIKRLCDALGVTRPAEDEPEKF